MKSFLLLIFIAVFLTACNTMIPLSQSPADNNPTYIVDFLFEHEGIEVYRFLDDGRYVYFTKPVSDVTSIRNDSTRARVTTHSVR
jgi:hypothetical protein